MEPPPSKKNTDGSSHLLFYESSKCNDRVHYELGLGILSALHIEHLYVDHQKQTKVAIFSNNDHCICVSAASSIPKNNSVSCLFFSRVPGNANFSSEFTAES